MMMYLSPYEKRRRRATGLRTVLIVLAGFVLASLLDFPLLHLFYMGADRAVEHHDWYRMLRVLGFLGTWGAVAIVFILHQGNRHRGSGLFLAALVAGAIAELGKLLIGRQRPVEDGIIRPGLYHFRPLFSGFSDGSNLGLPSSHVAVAFAGCLMLGAFFPAAKRFLILLAIGCALTRMLTGAHFTSDVYLGAILGWIASIWFIKLTPGLGPRYRTLR